MESTGSTSDANITLASKGRPTRVSLNQDSQHSKPTIVTHEKLDELQSGLGNLSNKKMKGTANWMRTIFGRKSIPSGYKAHLAEESKLLDDLYHVNEPIEFDGEKGFKVFRPVVYTHCDEILDKVCDERGFIGVPNVIVQADGGGGFFKICASILPENHTLDEDEEEMIESMSNMESPVKSKSNRSTYAEGGTMKMGKLSGVKRVIPLAFVPEIKESHRNLEIIIDLIKLNNIPFKAVVDYKINLILCGCQTASATSPCPYCFVKLQELAKRDLDTKPFFLSSTAF